LFCFGGGAHLAKEFDGFGIGFEFLEEGFEPDIDGMLVGSAEAGPGVGEAGELIGILFAFADGFEDEGADEEIAARMGGGRVFAGGSGGEVVDAFDDAKIVVALGLFGAPAWAVGVVPGGEGDAEIADDDFFVGGCAGPDEGIRVAGFEVEGGNVAVGLFREEPVADLFVLPAVVQLLIEGGAEGVWEEGEAASTFSHGGLWLG